MSYVRWSKDSSVYVFDHVAGHVECCGCKNTRTHVGMALHLLWHKLRGDKVPRGVIRDVLRSRG